MTSLTAKLFNSLYRNCRVTYRPIIGLEHVTSLIPPVTDGPSKTAHTGLVDKAPATSNMLPTLTVRSFNLCPSKPDLEHSFNCQHWQLSRSQLYIPCCDQDMWHCHLTIRFKLEPRNLSRMPGMKDMIWPHAQFLINSEHRSKSGYVVLFNWRTGCIDNFASYNKARKVGDLVYLIKVIPNLDMIQQYDILVLRSNHSWWNKVAGFDL